MVGATCWGVEITRKVDALACLQVAHLASLPRDV
jgi:hypothetical protein